MARREIPTPTTAAEPANAGTIEIVATTHGTYPFYPEDSEYQQYLLIAKPGLLWEFRGFTIEWNSHHIDIYTGQESIQHTIHGERGTYDDDRQGYVYETDISRSPGYIDYPPQNAIMFMTDYVVTAHFRRTGHTDLLVNSSARESLVRLVHDPETNRLVADY